MNGAALLERDIPVNGPGLLHVLDRVMYPPTVGDIVKTLESDPEQRFTTLLKALKSTGLDKEIQDYSSELKIYSFCNIQNYMNIKDFSNKLYFCAIFFIL